MFSPSPRDGRPCRSDGTHPGVCDACPAVHLSGLLSSLDLTDLLSNPTRGERRRTTESTVRPNVRLRPEQARAVVQAYLDGRQLKDIAAEFGIHEQTVKAHVRRAGVPLRPVRVLTDDQVREASHLYLAERWSIIRLSNHLGCAEATIRSELTKAGLWTLTTGQLTEIATSPDLWFHGKA